MLKNVGSQKIGAQMVSATDGSAFTGSVTVAVTVDAGTQATGSVGSGACTHEGGGYHTYAPAQAETNGDLIAFTFSGTGAVPVTIQVYTLPTTGVLAPATLGRTLVVDAAGLADANMVKAGPTGSGTAQTARDIGGALPAAAAGASGGLLISGSNSGTTTLGALTVSGATTLTGAVTGTNASNDLRGILLQATQTGVTIPTVTTLTNAPSDSSGVTTLLSRIPSGIFTGITSLAEWLGLIAGKQTGNSTARTEIRATGAGSGTFDETTDSIEAIRDYTAPASTALSTSTWTTARAGYLDNINNSNLASVPAFPSNFASLAITVGGAVTAGTVSDKTGYALTSAYDFAKGTVAMTESYSTDGSAPTPAQSLMLIQQALTEFVISGTTMTIKKVDGSTTAATLTLNDGTSPTGVTRAS